MPPEPHRLCRCASAISISRPGSLPPAALTTASRKQFRSRCKCRLMGTVKTRSTRVFYPAPATEEHRQHGTSQGSDLQHSLLPQNAELSNILQKKAGRLLTARLEERDRPGDLSYGEATSPDEDFDCDAHGLSSGSVGGQGVGCVADRASHQGAARRQGLRP